MIMVCIVIKEKARMNSFYDYATTALLFQCLYSPKDL